QDRARGRRSCAGRRRNRARGRRQGVLRRAARRSFRHRPAGKEQLAPEVERSDLHARGRASRGRQGRDRAPWAVRLRGGEAMTLRFFAVGLLAVAFRAGAAITCSASVTAITVVYDPTSGTQNVTTGSYTVTCTRL